MEGFTHNSYTVGWICALSKELTAAEAMLDVKHPNLQKPPNDTNNYTLGSVGEHNVVIVCLPKGGIGNNSCATVATIMLQTFPNIKFSFMVGIGGGVPEQVRLGDVVIGTPADDHSGVVQWDSGKTEQGGQFKRTGSLNRPPNELLNAVSKLEQEHQTNGTKIPRYLDQMKYNRPNLQSEYLSSANLEDVLFRADYGHVNNGSSQNSQGCESCDRAYSIHREPRQMKVHYGLIASGNQVIKDAKYRDEINGRFDNKVLCFEMEAAGVGNSWPFIVIRGICDYADSHKNKQWQEYAASVAAAAAKELLLTVPTSAATLLPPMMTSKDRC
ncbi:purine and uridine phosphorylase [Aspergillus piperis CBS 112811]|uniref:Purine and uridine phosphorylase n=1 Tax=Aspergillus piperis CBS 112811 TaxID=1448313 RepID=A0A8G1R043_9EURO|nr:purine and uridine phosphorylase [Aspergillus piperis CBS 112811]RAH57073.1 purine and uridine phosphorylase [Aspergillus piperis CBS 112811]